MLIQLVYSGCGKIINHIVYPRQRWTRPTLTTWFDLNVYDKVWIEPNQVHNISLYGVMELQGGPADDLRMTRRLAFSKLPARVITKTC